MWQPETLAVDDAVSGMPGATQKLVPEQLLITRINSADRHGANDDRSEAAEPV
jgi:hypothetical protein